MSDAWKNIDLGGGGLQSANRRLAALLRKRGAACALLLLYPLGLHRDYLHDARGAWLYRTATLVAAAALVLDYLLPAASVLAGQAVCAIRDLIRLEDAVASLNKRLRVQVYLGQAAGAPQGFRGHYTDEKQVTGAHPARHDPASGAPPLPAGAFLRRTGKAAAGIGRSPSQRPRSVGTRHMGRASPCSPDPRKPPQFE